MASSGGGATFLVVNGVRFTGDVPPVATFLRSSPGNLTRCFPLFPMITADADVFPYARPLTGAYTTTRTHGGASLVLFWDRHLRRLAHSARILARSHPGLFLLPLGSAAGGGGDATALIDSIENLVHESLLVGLRLALRDRDRAGSDDELAITALVRGRHETDCLDVLLHLGFCSAAVRRRRSPFSGRWPREGAGGGQVHRLGAWFVILFDARVRQGMEKMRPPSATELLLTNDGDRILEGSVTNFFVVRRKVINDLTDLPPSDSESSCTFVVQTAPISDGVLPGVIRQLVFEICSSLGILVEESAPSWSDRELWQEAFITSSLRLVQHVETIQAPTSFKEFHLKTWNELSWVAAVSGPKL
ncbi:Aminotransferase class IV [Musa troglodytarum]|uniref:Aminotransferase class IV n=1 Tax=Musa troglodytarum TaxID=320322 RepID=A0A9E7JEX5_9LILI|nr:Aminotransferase class IV [Musa troglodytarum]